MTPDEIKAIQRKIKPWYTENDHEYGHDLPDGDFGPRSRAAVRAYLRSLMPMPNPWPHQSDRVSFFGPRADESRFTRIDVTGLGVCYDGDIVTSILVNQRCADSLLRILKKIAASPHSWILGDYGGCFADKPLMHGHAAAIDLAVSTNGMNDHWPKDGNMPLEVYECFAEEGWYCLGPMAGFDGMHAQATEDCN